MDPLLSRFLCVQLYSAFVACYCYSVVRSAKPGVQRLLLACPVITSCLALPLLLDPVKEPLLVMPTAGVLSTAAFKIAALCINRGPLVVRSMSAIQFAAVLLLPIIPSEVHIVSGGKTVPQDAGGSARLITALLADSIKQIGGAVMAAVVLVALPNLHWVPKYWLYILCACMFIGGVHDTFGMCVAPLGIQVAPVMNKPWLTDSLSDFWARRWNLTITYMLRVLLYEPVLQGKLVAERELQPDAANSSSSSTGGSGNQQDNQNGKNGSQQCMPGSTVEHTSSDSHDGTMNGKPAAPPRQQNWWQWQLRRLIALEATFLLSGVWHILVFYYNARIACYGWALFFMIQAPAILAESLLKAAWQRARLPAPPKLLRMAGSQLLLVWMGGRLFFKPADDAGFTGRMLATAQPLLDSTAVYRQAWKM